MFYLKKRGIILSLLGLFFFGLLSNSAFSQNCPIAPFALCPPIYEGGTVKILQGGFNKNTTITSCDPVCNLTFVTDRLPYLSNGFQLEYMWMINSKPNYPMTENNGWCPAPGINNMESYTPPGGCITSTSYYLRCIRIKGCQGFPYESNLICVIIKNCSDLICSYTQGFYGNAGGKHCGTENTPDLLNRLVSSNPIVLGLTSNNRSIKFTSGACILQRLPGGGASVKLPAGNITCEIPTGLPLTSAGKFKNTLLAQTLTLTLNVRLSPNLGTLPLTSTSITTAKASTCSSATATPISGTNMTFNLPASVINFLNNPSNGLSFGNSVNSLLELANKALAGEPGLPSLNDIATAADVLNNAFDECRILVSGATSARVNNAISFPEYRGNLINIETLKIYPNPLVNSTNIEFLPKNSGKVSVEIFDMKGKLIKALPVRDVKLNERVLMNVDASNMASGVYNCKVTTPDGIFNRKLVLASK